MPNSGATLFYRRREHQERATAAAQTCARTAGVHFDLAEGYRVLAEQAEQTEMPVVRQMHVRTMS